MNSRELVNLSTEKNKLTLSVLSAVFMGLLIAIVSYFNVPNPNMILIAGLVVCSALFGYRGGIPAGVIMLAYTLYFFSTNNDFVTFSSAGNIVARSIDGLQESL